MKVPRVVFLFAAFAVLFSAAYAALVFDRVPHIHDEMAYLFQAKIFRTGQLTAPSPCARESFEFPHLINNGRWYSIYPPGFPFLLLLGLLAGAPWLVNPILGGIAVLLFYALGREIYGRRAGIWAAGLGAFSIWHLLMSATMMSHTAGMVFNALFLFLTLRSLRRPSFALGAASGAALGMSLLVRPYNAFLFALPVGVLLLVRLVKEGRRRWKPAAGLAASLSVGIGLMLLYNGLTNGHPLRFGYVEHYGPRLSVVFGRAATLDYDYTPFYAFYQIGRNLSAVNAYLFGWPVSSLLALFPFLAGFRRKEPDRGGGLLLLSIAGSLVVGFYFYWGAIPFIGARMLFDLLPLLLVMSAKGLEEAVDFLGRARPGLSLRSRTVVLAGVVALLGAYGFGRTFPRWVRPPDSLAVYRRYDGLMAGSSSGLVSAVRGLGLRNAVVIVGHLYAPMTPYPTGWWSSGFLADGPRLDGDVIYAVDRGPANAELFACFPGRSFFLFVGTLEAGLLTPLSPAGAVAEPGSALTFRPRSSRGLRLVASPLELFRLYAPDFEAFLKEFLFSHEIRDLSVDRLYDLGLDFERREDARSASHCYEAALQTELDPDWRRKLLNRLAPCYIKTGQHREADVVSAKLSREWLHPERLFFVLPERGF